MFTNTNQSNSTVQKKRLAVNPFKPPTPVKRQNSSSGSQQTLNFFTKRSNSTLGLAPVTKKAPLDLTATSKLNQQAPPVDFFSVKRSSSAVSTTSRSSSSFEENHDDDVIITKTQTVNLKNSKPVGSLLTGLKPNEPKLVQTSSISRTSSSDSNPKSSASSFTSTSSSEKRSLPSSFKPKVTLGSFQKNSSGQTTLNFGSKDPAPKKRLNPWETVPVLSKKIKNPRIKDEPVRAPRFHQSSIMLSEEQQKVLKLVVEERENVFYTGSAGTGKSVLLRELVQALIMSYGHGAVAVTASTGLAAVNIGGTTINRFSGIGIGLGSKHELASRVKRNADVRERWKRTKVLIIDEISMLDGRFLDKLEYVARTIRNSTKPFGGVQIVLTGDFFQLPPVDKKDKHGSPIFCFESECWKTAINKTIMLRKVFRQADLDFVNLLNNVRVANVDDHCAQQFKSLSRTVEYEDGIQPTELFSTRYEVDSSNSKRLDNLPGEKHIYVAEDSGDLNSRYLLESTMATKNLVLKEDAQVMMLKNMDETLVNGSVGVVLAFLSEDVFTKVKSTLMREYELINKERVRDMRMLSKCYGQTKIPQEVIDYASRHVTKQQEFLQIAKNILTDQQRAFPIVSFSCNGVSRVTCVIPEQFKVGNDDNRDGAPIRTQVPLLLSWALSIHKSQGQTLDRVKVDLTRVFEAGQVYVALSRAVSKDRLQVINFQKSKITTNKRVQMFYEALEHL